MTGSTTMESGALASKQCYALKPITVTLLMIFPLIGTVIKGAIDVPPSPSIPATQDKQADLFLQLSKWKWEFVSNTNGRYIPYTGYIAVKRYNY